MGRGNTIIRDREGNEYPTYYIDYYDHDDSEDSNCPGEYDCSCNDMFYDDVIGNITYSIIPLFNNGEQYNIPETYSDSWRNNYTIYHKTNIFEVVYADNENSLAIGFIPILNENGKYNSFIFNRSVEKFIRHLKKIYTLSYRTSAWTSSKLK